jgi:hypothetical protein
MSQQPPFYLGATFLRRGYKMDSRGFPVDHNAPYDYEAENGVLLAFWRKGLPKPKNPPTLVKVLAGSKESL